MWFDENFDAILIRFGEPHCAYSPNVIAVTAPNYEVDKIKAQNQADSAGWRIMEFRESEFVKPGHIHWLCYECGKGF